MGRGHARLRRWGSRLLYGAAMSFAACVTSGAALAQHIVKPEVEKGHHEIEAATHALSGLNGGTAGDVRLVQELGYQYGLTHFWLI